MFCTQSEKLSSHFSIFLTYLYLLLNWKGAKLAFEVKGETLDGVVGLSLYHAIPTFKDSENGGFETFFWEKEKMQVTSIFSFSHSVFYSNKDSNRRSSNIYFVVCKCFQFGLIRNFVVW